MAIQKGIGEGIDPTIKEVPDGDILREILELLGGRIRSSRPLRHNQVTQRRVLQRNGGQVG